jgi:hypothetical protein
MNRSTPKSDELPFAVRQGRWTSSRAFDGGILFESGHAWVPTQQRLYRPVRKTTVLRERGLARPIAYPTRACSSSPLNRRGRLNRSHCRWLSCRL